MDGEGAVDRAVRAEQTLVEHHLCPAVSFFARLEHEQDPAGELVAPAGEEARRRDEHRHVGVVTAGMHRAVHPRGVVEPGVLRHGEGIHVASQQRRRAVAPAVEHGDYRGRLATCRDLEAEPVDRLEYDRLGPREVEADLGMGVDLPPESDGGVEEPSGLLQQCPVHAGPVPGPVLALGHACLLSPQETVPVPAHTDTPLPTVLRRAYELTG